MLEEGGVATNGERWLKAAERATLAALAERGPSTAAELSKVVPALRTQIRMNEGKKYEGLIGLSTRVLFLLAAQGLIVRTRPRGSWLSSQYEWSLMEGWLPGGGALPDIPVGEARAALARLWLARFGPGTFADLKWW